MDKRFKHTLVAFKICPYCMKVLTIMCHKNVKFEIKFIEMHNKPDWFLKLSPLERVPILIIGEEVVLFESAAIMEYIDEITPPKLMPDDPIQKAIDRAKFEYSNEIIKNLYQFVFCLEQEKFINLKQWLIKHFKQMEEWLKDKQYINGTEISLVDFNFVPVFVVLNMLKPILPCDMLKDYKRLQNYGDSLTSMQCTKTGRVPDYEFLMIDGIKNKNTVLFRSNPCYFNGPKASRCCFFGK
ncbi:unnamed protein product [Paramecium pentaurelia]|uniref:Glutathione S-transferase n=1 Tax=Paramecium pentaurelia TaxID=43138 RepID=A0A8S1XJG6_9CILI|nr:unnamed protein product [Paramecium pentaurelia]